MTAAVVNLLKTGSVANVASMGGSAEREVRKSRPYVIVVTETYDGGRRFRVIAHFDQGQRYDLEDYIREVMVLLSGATLAARSGAVNRLSRTPEITDVTPGNDDGTISMEASFTMPTRTF